MNKLVSIGAHFAAVYVILSVLQRPARIDAPVPGIDPMNPFVIAGIATAVHAVTTQLAGG